MHGLFTFSAHPHKHLSARFGTTLLKKNLNFQGAYRKYSSFFQEGWSTTWPAPFREDPFSPKRDPPGKRNSPSPIFSDFLHSPSSPLPVLPSALGAFTSLEHNLPPSLKNLIFLGRLPKKVKFFFFSRGLSAIMTTLCVSEGNPWPQLFASVKWEGVFLGGRSTQWPHMDLQECILKNAYSFP